MEPLAIPLWALYALVVPLTVVLLVKLAVPRRPAFASVGRALQAGATTARGRRLVAVIALVLALNSVQSAFDPAITSALGLDFTGWVHSVEGDWVERLQAPLVGHWWPIAWLTWVYVCVYVAVLLAPPVVWHAVGRDGATREHACGFLANYALAMPFYFFFPVVEVGWSDVSAAVPLMEDVVANISAQMRYESALDNCFPSLHVSCATTAAILCHRHGPAGLRVVGWAIAALTAYTVMALGVHWGLDVLAGVPFGLLNARVGIGLAAAAAPRDERSRVRRERAARPPAPTLGPSPGRAPGPRVEPARSRAQGTRPNAR